MMITFFLYKCELRKLIGWWSCELDCIEQHYLASYKKEVCLVRSSLFIFGWWTSCELTGNYSALNR